MFEKYKNNIQVVYTNRPITYGESLTKKLTTNEPIIKYNFEKDKQYTIMMVDPDAPSPENPTKKYVLHWLKVNVSSKDNGQTINNYMGPNPPKGTHRYYICVLEQKGPIINHNQIKREKFNPNQFISNNNLKLKACTKFIVDS